MLCPARTSLMLLSAFLVEPSSAQTQVSGPVAGVWNLAGSPYELTADVQVLAGTELRIEPGVTVIGTGSYRLDVRPAGLLTAIGTPSARILFTAQDTLAGWRGVRLEGADDKSALRYCVIEHVHFTSPDWQEVRGGALTIRGCSVPVEYCEIRYNSIHNINYNGAGGGVLFDESPSGFFRRNYVHHNSADVGGGVCIAEWGSPHMVENVVVDNEATRLGGGFAFTARSSPRLERNWILRNHANGWDGLGGGGGLHSWTGYVFYSTGPTLRSNVIAFNTASTRGGGAYMGYDALNGAGDLYAFNAAPEGGGIFVVNQGWAEPRLLNSILWRNRGSQIALSISSTIVDIQWSLVDGGWPGVGNLDADPLFLDPLGADGVPGTEDDDYRLAAGSPCIDAGNGAVSTGNLDQAGEPRRVDDPCVPDTGLAAPMIDIGPYERQSSSCCDDPRRVCSAGSNSTGAPAHMQFGGSVSIAADDLVLRATGCPPQQVALFFYGLTPLSTPIPFGNGLRCIGSPLFRILPVVTTDATGAVELELDLAGPPLGVGPGQVGPGTSAWFQLVYRDPAAGGAFYDTTDGLEITFCN